MTDASAMIERCGARQADPPVWVMFLASLPAEFTPPASAAYVAVIGEAPPEPDAIRARFADAAESLIEFLANPPTVGRADSVGPAPDPQGAADPPV